MNDLTQTLIREDMALKVPLDDGVQLIEASAGTGKTFTIAGLYARLVVERTLPLRNILVMTYTRAATEELRQRLRQRLARCAELAASPWLDEVPQGVELDAESAWSLALLRRALATGQDRAALAARLHQAVQGMDEAAIATIHGFCQRVLREHAALIAGASRDADLEPDDGDLLGEFAADAWLRMADDDAATREALRLLGDTPQALAARLKELVAFAGTLEPAAPAEPPPVPASPDSLREAVFAAWEKHGKAAVQLFCQFHAAGYLKLTSHGRDSAAVLQGMARQLRARTWPGATLLRRFAASAITAGCRKSAPEFPGHPAFDAIETWCSACQAWDAAVRERVPFVLHRLLAQARPWLARRKHALGRLSYDDQIELVHAGVCATAGRTLLDALRRQFPVALVDEFQDTDARQFEIFARLYQDAGALFCIGDPKQAIYGFRGGDVHAYLRARKKASQAWHLDHNFRSSPGLLRVHAALFGGRKDAFVETGIAFEPVQWGGKAKAGALLQAGAAVAPMTLWQLPDKPIAGGKDAVRDWLAAACAAEIARLLAPGASTLAGEPLEPKHVAVLVNSNDEAMRVQDALGARGVPSVCLRRESIHASAEAGELRRILDALLVPRDARLARGALATHLLGRNLDDLKATQDDDLDWHAELDDLRQRWFEHGILAMLERLGERHAERLLGHAGGERCLSNLMQLGDALQAEARRLATPHAQRDWLAERIAHADALNEDEQLRLESDAERVQVLTLHVSKGLEYDLVFLPFAALMCAHESKCGSLARFHRRDRLVMRYLGSEPAAGDGKVSVGDRDAMEAARREDLAEGVRKLYVGVTRARHACWMSVGTPSSKFAHGVLEWVLPDGVADLVQRGGDCIACQAVPDTEAAHLVPPVEDTTHACRSFKRDIDRAWWVHSFSRLADGGHGAPIPVAAADGTTAQDTDVPALVAGPRGPRFGSAVHAALERVDFAAWGAAPEAVPDAQRRLVADALRGEGFSTDAAHAAAMRIVAAALRTPLFDDLTLAALPATQRRAEMEFHFGIAGADPLAWLQLLHAHGYQRHRQAFAHLGTRLAGLMNGLIDLVFVHAGRWWVVDYKTNHLGDHASDYALARLPAAIAASDYDLQYLIYTVALHRWLRQVRGADYDYERDFGGVCYLFLRGMGVGEAGNGIFRDRPPAALIAAMDELLHAPGMAA